MARAKKPVVEKPITGAELERKKKAVADAIKRLEAAEKQSKSLREAVEKARSEFKEAINKFSSFAVVSGNSVTGKIADVYEQVWKMWREKKWNQKISVEVVSGHDVLDDGYGICYCENAYVDGADFDDTEAPIKIRFPVCDDYAWPRKEDDEIVFTFFLEDE